MPYFRQFMNIEYIKDITNNYLGKNIELYDSIESTQDRAKEIVSISENGTVVIADEQTNGRGTKQNKWYCTKGENIAMTIIFKPNCKISKLEGFTIKIAQCIKKAINQLYGYELAIKQPNDLLLNNKKIAGILTESSTMNDVVKYVLVGIGFNVNCVNFNNEIQDVATSLKKEYGKTFSREEIIVQILNELSNVVDF